VSFAVEDSEHRRQPHGQRSPFKALGVDTHCDTRELVCVSTFDRSILDDTRPSSTEPATGTSRWYVAWVRSTARNFIPALVSGLPQTAM
jgi:hypothetical protein